MKEIAIEIEKDIYLDIYCNKCGSRLDFCCEYNKRRCVMDIQVQPCECIMEETNE